MWLKVFLTFLCLASIPTFFGWLLRDQSQGGTLLGTAIILVIVGVAAAAITAIWFK